MIWNFAHVLIAAVYVAWWGLKVRMEKIAKWCHVLELYKEEEERAKKCRTKMGLWKNQHGCSPQLVLSFLMKPLHKLLGLWEKSCSKAVTLPSTDPFTIHDKFFHHASDFHKLWWRETIQVTRLKITKYCKITMSANVRRMNDLFHKWVHTIIH